MSEIIDFPNLLSPQEYQKMPSKEKETYIKEILRQTLSKNPDRSLDSFWKATTVAAPAGPIALGAIIAGGLLFNPIDNSFGMLH